MNITGSNDIKLGGQLVGIGKISKTGEITFNYLEKPIHNRITSAGLDHLLCYNGQPTGGFEYGSSNITYGPHNIGMYFESIWGNVYNIHNSSPHYGIMTYLGIGSDDTPTEFTDTGLHAQVGGLVSQIFNSSSSSFNTTIVDTASGVRTYRLSHTSVAVETETIVREVGWFGSHTSMTEPVYVMFSRVVLDSPITLEPGESLVTMYDLSEQTDFSIKHMTSFHGLTDSDGNALQCDTRIYNVNYPRIQPASNQVYMETGVAYGVDRYGTSYGINWVPPWAYVSHTVVSSQYHDGAAFSTSMEKTFSAMNSNDTDISTVMGQGGHWSYSFVDYTGVGNNDKYRDFKFVIGPMSPSISSPTSYVDIRYLRLRGRDYRFGYYEEDGTTWHSQALRKFGNQSLILMHRTRYITDDTAPAD